MWQETHSQTHTHTQKVLTWPVKMLWWPRQGGGVTMAIINWWSYGALTGGPLEDAFPSVVRALTKHTRYTNCLEDDHMQPLHPEQDGRFAHLSRWGWRHVSWGLRGIEQIWIIIFFRPYLKTRPAFIWVTSDCFFEVKKAHSSRYKYHSVNSLPIRTLCTQPENGLLCWASTFLQAVNLQATHALFSVWRTPLFYFFAI